MLNDVVINRFLDQRLFSHTQGARQHDNRRRETKDTQCLLSTLEDTDKL